MIAHCSLRREKKQWQTYNDNFKWKLVGSDWSLSPSLLYISEDMRYSLIQTIIIKHFLSTIFDIHLYEFEYIFQQLVHILTETPIPIILKVDHIKSQPSMHMLFHLRHYTVWYWKTSKGPLIIYYLDVCYWM